jgi:hypothetical protein
MENHICNSSCTHGISKEDLPLIEEEFQEARRSFIKNTLAASTSAAAITALGITMSPNAFAQNSKVGTGRANHYYVPATDKTVHWGFFSKSLKPLITVASGDFVTLETLTHHANDDAERMVRGDAGAKVFFIGMLNVKALIDVVSEQ